MSVDDELDKLKKLHDDGTITDEQLERAKAKLLDEEADTDRGSEERRPRRRDDEDDGGRISKQERDTRQWALFLHLSLLAGHAVPMGGIIAPILIWQIKKEELPEIDVHGKNAVNWIISLIIYLVVCVPLCFVLVGFALLAILGVLAVVFPIIAAMKANEGETWRYPLSITFLT